MGWTLNRKAKEKHQIIAACTQSYDSRECIRKSVAGNELWTIWLDTKTNVKSIVLFILSKESAGWGYKDIPESMYPMRFKCPLSFLKECTVQSEPWRRDVRNYHDYMNTCSRIRDAERRDAKRGCTLMEKSSAEV